ncbi:MAG: hypothetical protein GY861_05555 [bacterium]|nr:hypothetical protein [bacterium]
MLIPKTKIIILQDAGTTTLTYCNSITIENDWDMMTKTAVVSLPNKYEREGRQVNLEIKRGDAIIILLGYAPFETERFVGYVASMVPGNPFTLKCEGLMYKLKQKTLRNFSQTDITLKEYVEALWTAAELGPRHDNIEYDVQDTSSLGSLEFKDGAFTASEILQKIRDPYKFVTFQYGDKLKIGWPYTVIEEDERKTHEYIFNGSNGNIISENLEYQSIKDVKIVVQGEIINSRSNERTVRYAYYELDKIKISTKSEQGNTFSVKQINGSLDELEETMKRKLESESYTGFKGDFITFGIYPIEIGDIAKLTNYKDPGYDGSYYIKGYTESMSTSGYRHTIRLAKKVA